MTETSERISPPAFRPIRPETRVMASLAVIAMSTSLSAEHWPAQAALGVLVFVALTIARVPADWILRRLAVFLPALVLLTISFPAMHGFRTGWDLMFTILFRATVSFLALLWLTRVLAFDAFLSVLLRWRVPGVLVAMLAFMHRYLFVLWDELDRMRTAWRAREFGHGRTAGRSIAAARLIGMLVVRGLTRAERVHLAMLARGWDGTVRRIDNLPDDDATLSTSQTVTS